MKTKLFLFIIIGILLAVNVKGFAVSSPYWSDNPLIMGPGETKVVTLTLQNMVGTEDLFAIGEILQGNEIARILENPPEYDVPLGREDVKVNLEVSIPENTPLESKYIIDVNFATTSKTEKEGVQLNIGVRKLIDVYVREVPQLTQQVTKETETPKISVKSNSNYIFAIILLAVILVTVIMYLIRKKKVDAK